MKLKKNLPECFPVCNFSPTCNFKPVYMSAQTCFMCSCRPAKMSKRCKLVQKLSKVTKC